jgi:hypothetical protein
MGRRAVNPHSKPGASSDFLNSRARSAAGRAVRVAADLPAEARPPRRPHRNWARLRRCRGCLESAERAGQQP